MIPALSEMSALSQRSTYQKYLPAIYAESDFMGRFLMIFESIQRPIEDMVQNIAHYFDPNTTPEELLPWLASWVNIVLDDSWPIERRRRLVKSAVELFQWRGTRRGMTEYLRVYAGVEPQIVEGSGGIPLGGNTRLGWNTVLGSGMHHTFTVTLEVEDPESLNVGHLKAIIEAEKPAHAGYKLQIVKANS